MAGEARHRATNGVSDGVSSFLGGSTGRPQRHHVVEYFRGEGYEDQGGRFRVVAAFGGAGHDVVFERVCLDRAARNTGLS